ncbi:MAG TPA: hypothetical protein VHD32_11280 [Candidatus Didemnitutus sp.]|nr:hypothetical protein [Candidatus Didemnitutus sp.]
MSATSKFLASAIVLFAVSQARMPAQEAPASKGPISKLYLSETKGSGRIENNGQVYEPRQGAAFSARGTVMVTDKDSHQAYVMSSGTGLYLDANTQVQVNQFDQDRFVATPNTDQEPSVSHTLITIDHGTVATCTGQMMSGTTLVYSTPLANVNVRGRRVVINVTANATTISALEGNVTIRTGTSQGSSVTLQPGEKVVITPVPGGDPQTVVSPLDHDATGSLETLLSVACQARKTVAFDVANEGAGAGEVVAHPTVAANPPTGLTVSPDRLNSGQ